MNAFDQVQRSLFGQMEQLRDVAGGDRVLPARALKLEDVNPQGDFTDALRNAVLAVDDQQHLAGAKVKAVDSGHSDDLVGAMVESQKASVAFTALVQVRNKLAQAFDEVMRMPI